MLRYLEFTKTAVFLSLAIFVATESTSCDDVPEEQPYDIIEGNYDGLVNDTNSKYCLRKCMPGKSKICYYKFHVEHYTVMGGACGNCSTKQSDCSKPQCVTADGYQRGVLTANRRIPGPGIYVCKGDWIVVDVINQLTSAGVSIHWHGLQQRKTPWMDGVPMVTQCPILPGQTFRYYFEADRAGTYFWHSHAGLQKVDALEGPLIIHEPDSESLIKDQYKFDLPSHTVFIQDWLHTLADERIPGQQNRDRGQSPVTYLINGKGRQLNLLVNGTTRLPDNLNVPLAQFNVTKGETYRFRLIGGSCLSCPFRVSIQKHKLTLINVDGQNPVKAVTGDSIEISSGQRYDVVINASQPVGVYWMVVQGLDEECVGAFQVALLCYKGAKCKQDLPPPSVYSKRDPGYILNPHVSNCTKETLSREICDSQLTSLQETPSRIRGVPDETIVLPVGFKLFFNESELFQPGLYLKYLVPAVPPAVSSLINNVSYMTPPSPPLTQFNDIPQSILCNKNSCMDGSPVCECVNIKKCPKNKMLELILLDTTPPDYSLNLTHPFHLHGYDFYVVDQGLYNFIEGRDGWEIAQQFIDTQLKKSKKGRIIGQSVPTKDTVTLSTGGFITLRIITDNAGFWLFHCHFAYHLDTGMTIVLQAGKLNEMIPPPPNFPKCKQFVPSFDDIFKCSKNDL